MRKLPVTAAGYPLSPRQQTLLNSGSLLMLSPWTPTERGVGNADAARITKLGKINLFYLFSFSTFICKILIMNLMAPLPPEEIVITSAISSHRCDRMHA